MEEINIKKMNVAQVRRALFVLRSNWENHTPANPFCLSETMEGVGMTYSEFCFNFVMNHHSKRQKLTKNKKDQLSLEDSSFSTGDGQEEFEG